VDRWGRSSKIVISIRTFLKDRNKAEHEWKILGLKWVKWQSENYKWFSDCNVSQMSRRAVKLSASYWWFRIDFIPNIFLFLDVYVENLQFKIEVSII
jgi:hypothetical protein